MKRGIYHIIMAGGSGTRFWPLSRVGKPKQFLTLVGDRPLVRQAFDRAAAMVGPENVYVAAGRAHRQVVTQLLPALSAGRFIAEPCPRNTAPCIGLAALRLSRVDPDGILVVSPADHVYSHPDVLQVALDRAVSAAAAPGTLVTLGITPSYPATGYGYIEVASAISTHVPVPVKRFIEKPDLHRAREFLASGRYLWNSGVFVWRIDSILRAIETCVPVLWSGLKRIEAALGGPEEDRIVGEAFEALEPIAIDYAVMEKADGLQVIPTDPGWSDVGSWDAIEQLRGGDITSPAADRPAVLEQDASSCFVHASSPDGRLIALVGVRDLIVVDTRDALLVCRKGASELVGRLVRQLKERGRDDLL
ncbi:MAG: mannose-1-phosphate guanylyltransferase [Acidobacteriota bacterium]